MAKKVVKKNKEVKEASPLDLLELLISKSLRAGNRPRKVYLSKALGIVKGLKEKQ